MEQEKKAFQELKKNLAQTIDSALHGAYLDWGEYWSGEGCLLLSYRGIDRDGTIFSGSVHYQDNEALVGAMYLASTNRVATGQIHLEGLNTIGYYRTIESMLKNTLQGAKQKAGFKVNDAETDLFVQLKNVHNGIKD